MDIPHVDTLRFGCRFRDHFSVRAPVLSSLRVSRSWQYWSADLGIVLVLGCAAFAPVLCSLRMSWPWQSLGSVCGEWCLCIAWQSWQTQAINCESLFVASVLSVCMCKDGYMNIPTWHKVLGFAADSLIIRSPSFCAECCTIPNRCRLTNAKVMSAAVTMFMYVTS